MKAALVGVVQLVAVSLGSGRASAQRPAPVIPHHVGKTLATAHEPLHSVTSVRQLSDGHILVDDGAAPRLLLFDSTLTTFTVVVDTTVGMTRNYRVGGPLVSYIGDTTLLFDPLAAAFLVIDPRGRVDRVLALPIPADAAMARGLLTSPTNKPAVLDPQRRLVYQTVMNPLNRPSIGPRGGVMFSDAMGPPDTAAAIVRVDWPTHHADTLAYLPLAPSDSMKPITTPEGIKTRNTIVNPIKPTDDWVFTSDGFLALIRAHDYHIDWIGSDGSRTSSRPIPYEWHRLSDSEKVAIVDSTKQALELVPWRIGTVIDGQQVSSKIVAEAVDPANLPDYRAPFLPGTVRADGEGNVWLLPRPSTPNDDGPIYDVVNRQRGLIDRVQFLKGFTIVGFGPGVVYMTSREPTGTVLVRASIR